MSDSRGGEAAGDSAINDGEPDQGQLAQRSTSHRLPRLWVRLRCDPRVPLAVLGLVSVASLIARVLYLNEPTGNPPGLIFDEKYYVNAARRLLGFPVPCANGVCDPYSDIAAGTDGNAEHPPLGKLLIAAGMKVFGNTQLGWRIAPLIFGSIAILAVYWLVRSAGGSGWLSVGAASLMAVDNLSFVHGRIATLDVFVVVFMMVAVALYLRGHPIYAGAVLGLGCCVKLVAPFAFIVLVLVEMVRILSRREWRVARMGQILEHRLVPLLYCAAVGLVVYLAVLTGLDVWVRPFHNPADSCPGSGNTYSNALVHTRFMLCYADKLTNPNGAVGIASYPWQWLVGPWEWLVGGNYSVDNSFDTWKWINYYSVEANGNDKVHFIGVISPAIIFLAVPAFILAVRSAVVRHDDVSVLAVCWCLATFMPFVLASWLQHRISYLYYMVVVLPGIYVAVALLVASTVRWLRRRRSRVLRRFAPATVVVLWVLGLAAGFYFLYPVRTWTGG
ncbi:MAG TPA: phospholipid carrier-dependent glycosyltransferase [Candidatus Dormibacteraeota bacterium]|nr:phospholipid carrier-dependent glycosyltransferase [Candidatus Dormibacteraeota bacterium]